MLQDWQDTHTTRGNKWHQKIELKRDHASCSGSLQSFCSLSQMEDWNFHAVLFSFLNECMYLNSHQLNIRWCNFPLFLSLFLFFFYLFLSSDCIHMSASPLPPSPCAPGLELSLPPNLCFIGLPFTLMSKYPAAEMPRHLKNPARFSSCSFHYSCGSPLCLQFCKY